LISRANRLSPLGESLDRGQRVLDLIRCGGHSARRGAWADCRAVMSSKVATKLGHPSGFISPCRRSVLRRAVVSDPSSQGVGATRRSGISAYASVSARAIAAVSNCAKFRNQLGRWTARPRASRAHRAVGARFAAFRCAIRGRPDHPCRTRLQPLFCEAASFVDLSVCRPHSRLPAQASRHCG